MKNSSKKKSLLGLSLLLSALLISSCGPAPVSTSDATSESQTSTTITEASTPSEWSSESETSIEPKTSTETTEPSSESTPSSETESSSTESSETSSEESESSSVESYETIETSESYETEETSFPNTGPPSFPIYPLLFWGLEKSLPIVPIPRLDPKPQLGQTITRRRLSPFTTKQNKANRQHILPVIANIHGPILVVEECLKMIPSW